MSGVVVRVFPSEDERFRAAVEGIAASAQAAGDRVSAQVIETALRSAFPAIHVVAQDPLGQLREGPVLYVYRDGAVMPSSHLSTVSR